MKRYLLILVGVMAAAMGMALRAQAPASPISWHLSVKMKSATEGAVTLKATVAPGWHLYSTTLPSSDGPRPTSITFSHPSTMTFTSPMKPSVAVVEKDDPMFGVRLAWWDTDVTFTRPFTTTNPEAPGKIDVKISFMGCNDETCLPPATVELSRTVKPFAK
ncbi:MAG: protein-disulfide reductase DsbD N-terminal domain-containing protein [Duncaniella sp.]|nr:protein-disulfide reductase DsbD N-terminal domain-containing protein [Duncaniella sp.]